MAKFVNIEGQVFNQDLVIEAWAAQKQNEDYFCLFVRFNNPDQQLKWYGHYPTQEEADAALKRVFR